MTMEVWKGGMLVLELTCHLFFFNWVPADATRTTTWDQSEQEIEKKERRQLGEFIRPLIFLSLLVDRHNFALTAVKIEQLTPNPTRVHQSLYLALHILNMKLMNRIMAAKSWSLYGNVASIGRVYSVESLNDVVPPVPVFIDRVSQRL